MWNKARTGVGLGPNQTALDCPGVFSYQVSLGWIFQSFMLGLHIWTCEDLLEVYLFHTHMHTQSYLQQLLSTGHKRAGILHSCPFLCLTFIHRTCLISSMLVTVMEFHTERICDADTRWFCVKWLISLSLPLYLSPPSQGIWWCRQKTSMEILQPRIFLLPYDSMRSAVALSFLIYIIFDILYIYIYWFLLCTIFNKQQL